MGVHRLLGGSHSSMAILCSNSRPQGHFLYPHPQSWLTWAAAGGAGTQAGGQAPNPGGCVRWGPWHPWAGSMARQISARCGDAGGIDPPLNHTLNFSLAKQTQQHLKGVGNAHG